MPLKIVVSEDGSHTILDEALGESYHSLRGALGESGYVFIEKGLRFLAADRSDLAILEVGLGTGLNVLLTAREATRSRIRSIAMTSLEPEPLPADLIERLNYASLMPDFLPAGPLLERVHRGNWDVADSLIPGFQFTKHRQRLEDFQPCACYDLIYFDAFAPGKQASVWAEENIEKMFACLTPGGILVTYCAQGAFRRSLRKAGFTTERLPGFAKREMTRATKPVAAVPHLS